MPIFKLPDGTNKEFATVDEARAYRAKNFQQGGNGDLVPPTTRTVPGDIGNIIGASRSFPLGSIEQARMLENAKKMRELTKGDPLAAGETEDINTLVDAINTLQELTKFKSTGSAGDGVDTGPIMGAKIPIPGFENPPLVPASLTKGGDRAEFRRKVLSFMNPYRKAITGAQASEKELTKFIQPAVPEESDQDLDFFSKAFGLLPELERRKRDMIENLRKSGKDITGFEDLIKGKPEDVINNLIKAVSSGLSIDEKGNIAGDYGKYSLPAVDPERVKKVIGSAGGLTPAEQARKEELERKYGRQ